MAKEAFTDKLGLNPANKQRLAVINNIIEEYRAEGYKLTLRQLYYQLVTKNIIPNKDAEYKKLGNLLVKGRMAGVVDWEAIEDRIRVPFIPYWVDDVADAINDTINQYRLNRQKGQDTYIELWVEKDALSGVLRRITSKYHINLMVNRGYSSASAMYDAYKRFLQHENIVILYLGDHDPSGLDMVRDIRDRLETFGLQNFEVKHIGLTQEQIKKYNPPPNPAKITDTRAKWYIENFGNTSWEVDALTPQVLHQLVQRNVEALIDMDLFEEMRDQEDRDKERLEKFKEASEDGEAE